MFLHQKSAFVITRINYILKALQAVFFIEYLIFFKDN